MPPRIRRLSCPGGPTLSKSNSNIAIAIGDSKSFSRQNSAKYIQSKPLSRTSSEPGLEQQQKTLKFSLTSIMGRRDTNEDSHAQFVYKNLLVVAIFDGHNGEKASQICGLRLEEVFQHYCEKEERLEKAEINYEAVLRRTTERLNQVIIEKPGLNECGTTSLIVVVDQELQRVHVSNIGDCRFIIGYRDNTYKETYDHKPENAAEKERIERADGKITQVDGVYRVNKNLAVARSIGDKYMKEFVICGHDYYEFSLHQAAYMVLGCDGLFDAFSSQQVHCMLMQVCNRRITDKQLYEELNGRTDINTQIKKDETSVKKNFENVCMENSLQKRVTQALTKMAYMKGSTDNISVMVAFLNNCEADPKQRVVAFD